MSCFPITKPFFQAQEYATRALDLAKEWQLSVHERSIIQELLNLITAEDAYSISLIVLLQEALGSGQGHACVPVDTWSMSGAMHCCSASRAQSRFSTIPSRRVKEESWSPRWLFQAFIALYIRGDQIQPFLIRTCTPKYKPAVSERFWRLESGEEDQQFFSRLSLAFNLCNITIYETQESKVQSNRATVRMAAKQSTLFPKHFLSPYPNTPVYDAAKRSSS
ncbi:hypothetical protein J0S82_019675 [Galemys pyrenaicus]|uniref:Uncharacterized protein n=1 Tax=Galemys pyrenaicus TaxID=202257 RepID=A0A8J5ZNH7_GALPY|nr:hypothetical protein J0S82_019675 [Galemys pyrenaicus]